MIIQVYPNAKAVAQAAAMLIAAQITKKPDSVLGLATGSTPIDTYQELIRLYQEKAVDFSKASTFNLDEYVHLPISHACSYHAFMQVQLFDHVNFKASFLPDGNAKDLNRESRRYDTAIQKAGGLDLQLLGIGFNGHIAFNEPMSEKTITADDFAALPSRVIALEPLTIATNARLTADNDPSMVPTKAITMGMKSILAAKQILLLACFEEQERPLSVIKSGRVTPELPASFLLKHPNSQIVYTKDSIATL